MMFKSLPTIIVALLLLSPAYLHAAAQGFPAIHNDASKSVFLIKPTEAMAATPSGWTLRTDATYGNSSLAQESLYPTGGASAATATTTSYTLPLSTYDVSVLVRGKGKARIAGTASWIGFDAQPSNKYQWITIGTTAETTQVAVDVAYDGSTVMYYAGVCLEGNTLSINPVSQIWQKIQNDERVVIVLLGDSVTENAYGTGGGASSFDMGNPGLMKAFLEGYSALPIDYITHREPPTWPAGKTNADLLAIPTTTIDGEEYLDARQALDESKTIHLVNLGKGGADSSYGWSRFRHTITEQDYKFSTAQFTETGQPSYSVRHGLEFYQPDLVIVNFGTNDNNGVPDTWTSSDYLFHMKTIATNLQQRFDTAIILSTPHKWNEGTFIANHWEPELVVKLRDYTAYSGFAFSDVFIAYELGQGDAIHPYDTGHGYLAQTYIKAIKGEAQTPASSPTITSSQLVVSGGTVTNTANGVMMMVDPNSLGWVQSDAEATALLAQINAANTHGYNNWRFPTPEELFPMIDQTRRPAVIDGAPFVDLSGFYYHGPVYNWQGLPKTSGFDFTVGIVNALGTNAGTAIPAHIFPVRTDTQTVPSPVFSPNGGTVAVNTPVVITATSGLIYYTLDGSDPRAGDGSVNPSATLIASGSSVTITTAVALNARALLGGDWSTMSSAAYTIGAAVVPAPVFTPGAGSVPANTPVVISATSGAIYYTLDGSDPRAGDGSVSASATLIASGDSVTITTALTLNARVLLSSNWSALSTAAYTIDQGGSGDSLWGEDDFEDGDYTNVDASLSNGLSWELVGGGTASVYESPSLPTSMRLRIKSDNTVILVKGSAQAPTRSSLTAPFSVEFFDAQENHVHDNMGLIFLYKDTLNHYKLEISDTEVAVHRVMGGVETTIGSSIDMKMKIGLDSAKFNLQVEVSPTELTFTVTKSEKTTYGDPVTVFPDVETITWSDSNASALATFKSGRIGFYQFNIPSIYQTPHYDDIVITDLMLDLDNDRLDDLWELLYFSSITVTDGSGNDDGDSLNDGKEFIAGTNPTDATSAFKAHFPAAVDPASGEITLNWSSVAGKTYAVQSSTTLDTDDWTTVIGLENEAATPPDNSATFPSSGSDKEFFRIKVK